MRANLKTARRAMVDSNPFGKSKIQPRALGDFKRIGRDCKTTSVARPDERQESPIKRAGVSMSTLKSYDRQGRLDLLMAYPTG